MAYELKQSLKLTQQLIMTPQLQQAIKLLQLSRLELVDMIQQEIEENPLLEESATEEYAEEEMAPEVEDVKVAEKTVELTGEGDGKEEFDWDSYIEDYGPMRVSYDREDDEGPSWENMLTKKTTLTDHLIWQLSLSRLDEQYRRIGEQIIGNLDNNGYLVSTVEEIAAQEGVDAETVEAVLRKIQEFDPPGVAARDLKECLLIQSKYLGVLNPLAEAIIRDHLNEMETKNYNAIARKMKMPLSAVLDAVLFISNMDPKPGLLYNEDRAQYIVPDVYVFKVTDEYKIILNDEGLPRLRISNFYREILGGVGDGGSSGEECKKYIKDRLQSATWLIKSIQQRQRTIYKVTESIVKFQREFFDQGINFLKPLVLRDVADDVEMHESTISRVTTNKYVHTPRGIFELKYFFNSSISRTSGDFIASKSVQADIRKIISMEDARKPLSDSEIVEKLSANGIAIARRTVAKYREMMGILPSSKRKKYFFKPKA
ncbi:MAG: RNA polymerase factor sigma-54 [Deltaproteobacteria bacterium]|nr:RNA polymerase factor sigma-54 [Deltaproteobacteria bacterium]